MDLTGNISIRPGGIDSLTQNKQNLLSSTNLLNASYIWTGIINNTVFNYLSGVTSDR